MSLRKLLIVAASACVLFASGLSAQSAYADPWPPPAPVGSPVTP